MSIAYNSKVSKFPISKLTDILCLNTDTETQKLCEQFGLNIVGSSIQFMKNSFKDCNVVSSVTVYHIYSAIRQGFPISSMTTNN